MNSVIREGVIAAALTSLTILIFLGSWRSTLINATSIPLSVLGSIAALSALGEIDAPDLDQQIMQAEANLASAQANSKLSDATLQRGQQLIPSGAVSKQDLDQRAADASNKQGLVRSAQANLDRLRVLEKYKRIVAPFDGLVTARNTDVGALINAGAGTGPAMFVVSDVSKLRAYVNVPQNYVPSIKIGTEAQITVPEYPGRHFRATVEASAQAVDVASGTTRMLLVVDNAKGELMTGDFANVSFDLPHPEVAINIPASALIFDRSGLRIATIDAHNRVVLKPVTISRDLGRRDRVWPNRPGPDHYQPARWDRHGRSGSGRGYTWRAGRARNG